MKKFMLLILLNIFLGCHSQYNIENGNYKSIDNNYAKFKDKDHIYFLGEAPIILKEADFKTFKAYKKLQEKDKIIYDAEDKNSYYYQGKIVKNK